MCNRKMRKNQERQKMVTEEKHRTDIGYGLDPNNLGFLILKYKNTR